MVLRPKILEPRRLSQEDLLKFQSRLGYRARPCLNPQHILPTQKREESGQKIAAQKRAD